MNKNLLYRSIPKVDILLENEAVKELIEEYSRDTVMESIHGEMDKLRKFIGQCDDEEKAKVQILADAESAKTEVNDFRRQVRDVLRTMDEGLKHCTE